MLDMNKWTELVKPFDEQSPQVFVTTLQFGEYKTELANVEALAIRFNKSGNEEYGNFFYSIHFGAYVQYSEMLNVVAYMPITKDLYDLISEKMDKLWDKELLQLIQDKFNLDLSCFNFSVHSKRINFELLNKKQNQHFDFVQLAELVFKQLGLFE